MTTVVGIDPGVSPAVAVVSSDPKRVYVERIPRVSSFLFDSVALRRMLKKAKPDLVVIESMRPIAGQGLSSTSALMSCFGQIVGIVDGCRFNRIIVEPVTWKDAMLNECERGLHIPEAHLRKKHQKRMAIRKVMNKYPGVVLVKKGCRAPDHNRAEAVILADYGLTLS